MTTERGKFIIFEGIGGSGKTSQLDLASEYLTSIRVNNLATREPGGSAPAESIREMIFKLKGEGLINADFQAGMFFSARTIWKRFDVEPVLLQGKHVLSDRSYPATGAFQGYGEGGDVDWIERISLSVMSNCMPNAIVLLDVSVETALARNANHKDGDPFDDEDFSFQQRVVNGYREMASKNWSGVKWFVINAEPSLEEVHSNVKKVLHEILKI